MCRSTDAATGRAGPSAGLAGTLLLPLLGHVIRAQAPALWSFYGGGDDVSMAGVSDANVRVVKRKGGYWEVNRVAGTVCAQQGWKRTLTARVCRMHDKHPSNACLPLLPIQTLHPKP